MFVMARKTRMYIPGIPVHAVQRGHNRSACFFSEVDYLYYKEGKNIEDRHSNSRWPSFEGDLARLTPKGDLTVSMRIASNK